MTGADDLFRERVQEKQVADILRLIAEMPNRRDQRHDSDISGQFDFWFDSGACRVHTGWQEFLLEDGTRAHVACPIPSLSVSTEFPDGRRVTVEQAERGSRWSGRGDDAPAPPPPRHGRGGGKPTRRVAVKALKETSDSVPRQPTYSSRRFARQLWPRRRLGLASP